MEKRLFITIALCLGILMAWQILFPPPRRIAPQRAPVSTPSDQPIPIPAAPLATTTSATSPPSPERIVTVETPRLRLGFSTYGASVAKAELLDPRFRKSGSDLPIDLAVTAPGEPRPLSSSVTGGAQLAATDAWEVTAKSPRGVTFQRVAGALTLIKSYDVAEDGFTVQVNVSAKNSSGAPIQADLSTLYPELAPATNTSISTLQVRAICRAGDSVQRLGVDAKKPTLAVPGTVSFAGVDEHYFLAALVPVPAEGACELSNTLSSAGALVSTRLTQTLMVPALGTTTKIFIAYFGPKSTEALGAADTVGARLEEAIEFGFFGIIARLLLTLLKAFHSVVPNWGVSIIVLTVAVKLATLPLTQKSMKSAQQMQQLQPHIEALKKKHGADQQRMAAEQMKLFKEHGVSPLGGCLPMLLQMPIWIALYTALQTSAELYRAGFVPGWIPDLTAPDAPISSLPWLHLLPLLMGASSYVTQALTPQTGQNAQQMKMMMYSMPLVFSYIMWSYPSGLTLYIFTSNLLSIVQQALIKRGKKAAGLSGVTTLEGSSAV